LLVLGPVFKTGDLNPQVPYLTRVYGINPPVDSAWTARNIK
jgi:hypothetical protein